MNPFSGLSDENKQQVIKYLRFFRAKRDGVLRGMTAEFDDAKDDRLREDVFSKDDLIDFSNILETNIKAQVSQEISNLVNMSAIAINNILESSQEQGAVVVLETAQLESEELIRSVEKMSLEAIPSDRKRGTVQLTSFKDDAKSLKDEAKAARDETQRLEDNNRNLQSRFTTVQAEATKLAREKSMLQNELNELRRRLEDMEEGRGGESKGGADRSSNSEIQKLRRELEEERELNSRRVSEAPQFVQMKKLMQNQTVKIKDLRKRLSRYEPDDSKMDDDDDA